MKCVGPSLLVVCALVLAACEGSQSALSPHGPDASRIATLFWLLFGMMTAVLVIVLAATALAISGPSLVRDWIAQERTIVIGGLIFPALVLSGLLIYGLSLMRTDGATADLPAHIEVSGEQWWWRVKYRLPDGRVIESANEIRLPVGQTAALTLSSPDVIHSLWIPNLAGKVDMIPGRTTSLRLKADRVGIYRGACAEYCGGPHALMALHVVAMETHDFQTWIISRARFVPDEMHERGHRLFMAAGCGGCHAIDGTEARGLVGPNLSDLGSRHSIGAGLLPMSQESISRFLVHGQRLKPGNKMPPFQIFDDGQLADIASFLVALK
jgi:cytochrome c oxidase subunit II